MKHFLEKLDYIFFRNARRCFSSTCSTPQLTNSRDSETYVDFKCTVTETSPSHTKKTIDEYVVLYSASIALTSSGACCFTCLHVWGGDSAPPHNPF